MQYPVCLICGSLPAIMLLSKPAAPAGERMRVKMENELIFRIAARGDLPVIVDIYNSTVPGRMVTADTKPVTVDERVAWFLEHDPATRPLWVLETGGDVCGWVSLQSFYGRPAYAATAEVSLYLREDCRGKGLGRKILYKTMEECPKLGIDTLLGFVFAHNHPSIRLFSGLGFEPWAHLPGVANLDGVRRDLVILGKRLD